jgi:dihydroorotase
MNELLALGFPLTEVIAMATGNAAEAMGLSDEVGSLAPGRPADVTILVRDQGAWQVTDCLGVTLPLAERLRPEFCLRAGVVHRADASLLAESTADVA